MPPSCLYGAYLIISPENYLITLIQHILPSSTLGTLTMNDLLGYIILKNPNYAYLYLKLQKLC